jgi:hypothetical protein
VNDYFKCNILVYKKAKYLSGNIISSLPLELLTNETTLSKMFAFDTKGEIEPFLHIGYAFHSSPNYYKYSSHLLKRKYLSLGVYEAISKYIGAPSENKYNHNCT